MPTWLGILIVVVADLVAVVVMLLVRRRAPEGGYYNDTQQAGWVYSVAGTSFAVVLAFVFLLTFQSFDRARTSASTEAQATASMFHTAELFPTRARDALQGELICYARGVVSLEWPAMRRGRQAPAVEQRLHEIERTFDGAPAARDSAKVGGAYDAWFSYMQERQDGRQGRLDQRGAFVPTLVWIFLLGGGALVVGFVWLFADRSERPFAQAALPIGVTTIVAAGLVMVAFFDAPYQPSEGAVRPTAMERQLASMQAERAAHPATGPLPCDAQGRVT